MSILDEYKERFHNKELFQQALTRSSKGNEPSETGVNNERLEFLGDSVLGAIVADYLYEYQPEWKEHSLALKREEYVQNKNLAIVAEKIGIGHAMRLGRSEEQSGRSNVKNLAQCLEAFIGALWRDQGYDVVEEFILKHILGGIASVEAAKKPVKNTKTQLKEFFPDDKDSEESRIEYRHVKEEGPDHCKTFYVEVYVDGIHRGSGKGKSKKEAELEASAEAVS